MILYLITFVLKQNREGVGGDVKNPHLSGIPAGIAPFGAPWSGIFSLWGWGWGQKFPRDRIGDGGGDHPPAPRGPCIYKKTILPLINISNIHIYLYFYVISHLFNLIIKN